MSVESAEALGLKALWEAGVGTTSGGLPAADGDLVDQLTDQSSLGHNLTGSGSTRFRYRANAINDHAAIETHGGKVMVSAFNCGVIMSASAFTVLAVVSSTNPPNAGTTTNNGHIFSDAGGKLGLAVKNTPSIFAWNDDGSADSITPIATPDFLLGTWYVVALVHSGGVLSLSLNGGSASTVNSGGTTSLASIFKLGSNFDGTRFWRGLLAEMWVYDTGLAAPDLAEAINELMIKYGLGGHVPAVEGARLIGSSKLNQTRVPTLAPSAVVGIRDALDYMPGDILSLSHYSLPESGLEPWQRLRTIVEGNSYDPGGFEHGGSGGDSTLRLRDLAPAHALHWDVGRTTDGGSGSQADGVARLGVGQALTLTRSARVWVDNPGDQNQIIEIGVGVEAQAYQGHLVERASAGNYQLRSSGVSGLTGMPAKSGSGTRALDTANLRFDRDVTPNSLNLLADATITTAFKQPWPATTTAFGASDTVVLSIDVLNLAGDYPGAQVIRASDGFYLTAAWGWTVTETWLNLATAFALLDTADAWERRVSGRFTPGATTVQVKLGYPTSAAGSSNNSVAHVQLGGAARWPSSRMVSDDEMIPRDLTVFARANAATPMRSFPTGAFTWLHRFRPEWAYNDSSTHTFTDFSVTIDANNWIRLHFAAATGLWTLQVRRTGTTVSATIAGTHARNGLVTLAARFTGADGEQGLSPFTASAFCAGVKGTDAVAAGLLAWSGSPALYIGGDGATLSLDAALGHNRLVARAMSDDEIARWP